MLTITQINKSSTPQTLDTLRKDVIKHVFAYYDLQHEPEHTTVYAAYESNKQLKGYILIYTALDWTSVILESDEEAAEKLIIHAPENHFVTHTSPNLLSIVKSRFPNEKHYVEDWMTIKKRETKPIKTENTRKLQTKTDAKKLARLLSTRKDRKNTDTNKHFEMITKHPTFGVFINNKLVAYAGSFIQLPQVWMIGGVYTNPAYRNKGYATQATFAITREALTNAETAALFVRSDNYPAIKAYEKIGYKKIGEKLWIDVGTGLKP
jgi:RimJ/RimL family protein N-acetyltransferase